MIMIIVLKGISPSHNPVISCGQLSVILPKEINSGRPRLEISFGHTRPVIGQAWLQMNHDQKLNLFLGIYLHTRCEE